MIASLIKLAVLGLVVWLADKWIGPKLPPPVRTVIGVVLLLILILWLLQVFGIDTGIRLPL